MSCGDFSYIDNDLVVERLGVDWARGYPTDGSRVVTLMGESYRFIEKLTDPQLYWLFRSAFAKWDASGLWGGAQYRE